ncbi:DUF4440 domain-containing protein [Muricauda sp. JGD-17]|uniref:DUF4440 domain-containing protein n=1 Tax=Flagellimonas ochracea TaxID=2696472 RepID=A0A964WXJ5_9FLAO|nr:nuclear transport factor 2 family protein [Allomuricauda ochracea]NAY92201.1 DUF4440 domain-containing protein [Allomuricauda ochracea]
MTLKYVAAIVCIGIFLTSCQNTTKQEETATIDNTITKEEALELLHNWTDAYLEGDSERLKTLLDDTWIYSGSIDGSTSNKSTTITEFESADYSFDEIKYQNLDVRLFDDIAVVRGLETMVILGSSKQDTTKLRLRFTDVYRKTNGEVRAIATHSSPVE